ncbi:MAG: dipeptidase [Methylocystaceae bacterium]
MDGHCDTLSRCLETGQPLWQNNLHWDICRASQAKVAIQFMALYNNLPDYQGALTATLEQIALLWAAVDQGQLVVITEQEDLDKFQVMGTLLHLEGGLALGDNLGLLSLLYRLGLRSMGLTWNYRNQLADGVGQASPSGLTTIGRKMLKRAEELGIIIDLAHLAAPGVDEVLELYGGTVVYSHGNYQEVHVHPRNITRDQAQRLAKRGGVIGLSLYPDFIAPKPSIEHWLQHLCRLCEDVGCEHVALGSDYDGAEHLLGDEVSFYQQLPELLKNAGFTLLEAELITGGNWLRILRASLPTIRS